MNEAVVIIVTAVGVLCTVGACRYYYNIGYKRGWDDSAWAGRIANRAKGSEDV
jgi:hypothetical protein